MAAHAQRLRQRRSKRAHARSHLASEATAHARADEGSAPKQPPHSIAPTAWAASQNSGPGWLRIRGSNAPSSLGLALGFTGPGAPELLGAAFGTRSPDETQLKSFFAFDETKFRLRL
jgi:hypothetical protein